MTAPLKLETVLEEGISKSKKSVSYALRAEMRREVLDIVRERFAPVAQDYEEFKPPLTDEDKESAGVWVNRFVDLVADNYDRTLRVTSLSPSRFRFEFEILRDEDVGVNEGSDLSSEFGWLFFYISGMRRSHYFVSGELLLRVRAVFENRSYGKTSPHISLIDEGLSRVGEFGDGFLLSPFEFELETRGGVSWSEILSERSITPPGGSIEPSFLEDMVSAINQHVEQRITEILEKEFS